MNTQRLIRNAILNDEIIKELTKLKANIISISPIQYIAKSGDIRKHTDQQIQECISHVEEMIEHRITQIKNYYQTHERIF